MLGEVLAQGGDCVLVAGFVDVDEEGGLVIGIVWCNGYGGDIVEGNANLTESCAG